MKAFFKKFGKTLGIGLFGLFVVLFGFRYYKKHMAPTRVAFVNYPEFQLSRIQKANDSRFIKLDILDVADLDKVRDYSAVFLFGRGFSLKPEQVETLKNAGFAGVSLYMEGATNPNIDVTNLRGENLDYITDYFRYGGSRNYKNLLNYVRQALDGKTLFADKYDKPHAIPSDVFFHLDETALFENLHDFETYGAEKGFLKANAPKVALITSVPGPFNATRDHLDAIITSLTKRGLNVYPMVAVNKRLTWLKEIKPDIAIMMPHGRLALGEAEAAQQWLKVNNVPLLSPLSVFMEYDKWVKDPQGMTGALLTMSVTLPELDGAINPYAIVAQYRDENNFLAFKAIPDRLEKFSDMVQHWLTLKKKRNAEKKIAIYYFKGPGLNSMVAANMEVVPSLFNTLKKLRAEGYNVQGMPATEKELWNLILKNGSVLAPYAEGSIDKYIRTANPELVSAQTYEDWAKSRLAKDLWQRVEEKYGKAPGSYMSLTKAEQEYIAVSRIQFGNVVLLPQPLPGIGNNTFGLIHGTKEAPPHPYIASYLWARNGFKADAIIHFGTHGSLEFTPGKQVALSDVDWPDVLVGNTPHFYVYTISNVGEGVIAKRRSYATTLSYLTPPFMEGGAYDQLGALEQTLHKFVAFGDRTMKQAYTKAISEAARTLKLYKDLGLKEEKKDLTIEQCEQLANLVEEIATEKVTGGLYTIGKPYTNEQLNNTVRLMAQDPLAYSMARLDVMKGVIPARKLDDKVYFNSVYTQKAKRIIAKALTGSITTTQVVSEADWKRTVAWQEANGKFSESEVIRGFIGLAGSNRSSAAGKGRTRPAGTDDRELEKAKSLLVRILPYPKKVEFIAALKSDKQFRMSSGLLDPATLERSKTIARAIPKMAEAIKVGQDPDVFALLTLMQKEPVRQATLNMLDDKHLAKRVEEEKIRIKTEVARQLQSGDYQTAFRLIANPTSLTTQPLPMLKAFVEATRFITENKEYIASYPSDEAIGKASKLAFRQIAMLERSEKEFTDAVLTIDQAIRQVQTYRQALTNSTEAELKAIVSGLNGGYISPSPGGDPVNTPATVPTGRNLVSVDAEKTPSAEAWEVGKMLGNSLIETHRKTHKMYPKKVAFTLWPGDFIQTEGAMLAQIFWLLGVEPVRDPFGRIQDIRLMPMAELKRPRIDVVVQTAGQFRDLAASRLKLINAAVKLAAEADEEQNFVKNGVRTAEKLMIEKGISPQEARDLASLRVFGGANGSYGTGIMSMVENGDKWESDKEIGKTYLNNMGAVYDDAGRWAYFKEGVFEAALQNTEAIVQPRQSNTWGALSLDHVYEFAGGLNQAVKTATGSEADVFFNDFRNPANVRIQNIKEAIWVEARSTLLNPKYIQELTNGNASSAEKFAETFRNTYGWNVMKPEAVDNELWNQLHNVYVKDSQQLGLKAFFDRENPFALQEMTAVMLETARKGYWKATPEQVKEITELHLAELKTNGAGCSGFVCNNAKLQAFIDSKLAPADKLAYTKAIDDATTAKANGTDKSITLTKTEQPKADQPVQTTLSESYIGYIVGGGLLLLVGLIWFIRNRKRR